jgi:DNA-directed RNA polymerase subunit N (RpoN/RPB10)
MIIPVRCFTCNRVIGSKYKAYQKYIREHTNQTDRENIISGEPTMELLHNNVYQEAFKHVGVQDRYCCKRHLVAHIDLIEKT